MCGEEIQATCLSEDCFHALGERYTETFKSYCYKRGCDNPACQRARTRRIKKKLNSRLAGFTDKYFITLTFKGWHLASSDTFDRINQAWRALAQWMRRNHGLQAYIKVIEAGLRPNQAYFFHIHAIIDSQDIPPAELSQAWLRITKDSYITKTLVVKSDFTDYLLKYIVKGYGSDEFAGRKLVSMWGSRLQVLSKGKKKCPHCGSALFFPEIDTQLQQFIVENTQSSLEQYLEQMTKVP